MTGSAPLALKLVMHHNKRENVNPGVLIEDLVYLVEVLGTQFCHWIGLEKLVQKHV